MTLTHKTLTFAGILLCSMGLPRVSYGITGCNNSYLTGAYNIQVSSANVTSLLNTLNSSGSTGSTGGGTTATTTNPGGFGNNPNSLTGKVPGLGRFFFDGNGAIIGTVPGSTVNSTVGSYTVNNDCTATMKLNSGETFNAILAQSGGQVLFIESDSTGGGAVGQMNRASSACFPSGTAQSFAFSFFGAQPMPATSGSGTATTGPAFQPASAVGSITLDGINSFALSEWVYSSGSVKPVNATGTYTVGTNCNLQLTFTQPSGSTTSALPAGVRGLLVSSTMGLLVVQTDQVPTDIVTGELIAQ
ncbi:MAG: hypothetical protein LAQ69_34340 [Acidobacteriia bacterium]|nr:hypothetical protein [Terriglobia bacterium]